MINFIHIPKTGGKSIATVCDNKHLKYCAHHVDPNKIVGPKMIVLRNPIDRFESTVLMLLQNNKYNSKKCIKDAVKAGFASPNDWARGFGEQIGWDILRGAMCINEDSFDSSKNMNFFNLKNPLSWVFIEQFRWAKNANNILIFENLENEFEYFTQHCFGDTKKIPHINSTKKGLGLSKRNIEFLTTKYKKDFELWDYWSNKTIQERVQIKQEKFV